MAVVARGPAGADAGNVVGEPARPRPARGDHELPRRAFPTRFPDIRRDRRRRPAARRAEGGRHAARAGAGRRADAGQARTLFSSRRPGLGKQAAERRCRTRRRTARVRSATAIRRISARRASMAAISACPMTRCCRGPARSRCRAGHAIDGDTVTVPRELVLASPGPLVTPAAYPARRALACAATRDLRTRRVHRGPDRRASHRAPAVRIDPRGPPRSGG